MKTQSKLLHMKVKFIFENEVLEGFVVEDDTMGEGLVTVKTSDALYDIPAEDILDNDDYGFSEETEERFYRWYSEE